MTTNSNGQRTVCKTGTCRFDSDRCLHVTEQEVAMEEKTEKFKKKRRGSAARRYNNYVKAIRKKHLTEVIYYRGKEFPYYNNLHQYSKNKIHCSLF